ncbi:hypothetical protein SCHPADRAFT_756412 [Schizopora paradoxa]|uniref:Uncharacterized protein n=1 Tax=Schizopora paradoxa TaxID=27342 RepID=A0A0H2QY74_9AGAM|nr:hypothetical protein SCHPADRAFT_756412 [Schizopora paradoxa]
MYMFEIFDRCFRNFSPSNFEDNLLDQGVELRYATSCKICRAAELTPCPRKH